jgi:hypothetical protein
MRIAKSFLLAIIVASATGDIKAQIQTSSPSPNSPFWSQGFNARSEMANQMFFTPTLPTLHAPKLFRMPSEFSNMNYAHILIAPSTIEPIVATGTKKRGDLIVTIPFRFRKVGTLAQPVMSERNGAGSTVMAAGARGFRVSPFRITQGEDFREAWCFTEASALAQTRGQRKPKRLCFFNLLNGGWISDAQRHAFPNTLRAPATRRANISDVTISALSADAVPEQKLEVRFDGWNSLGAISKTYVDGEFIEEVVLPKNDNGEAELKLLGQTIRLVRNSDQSSSTSVTQSSSFENVNANLNQSEFIRLNRALAQNLVVWGSYHGYPGFEALYTSVNSQVTNNPLTASRQRLRVQPNDVIATQTQRPTAGYSLQQGFNVGLKRYGKAGDLFFRVNVNTSLHVLCAYNEIHTLGDNQQDSQQRDGTADAKYCLEDSDNDNLYETIWRSPKFAPGSKYHLLDLASPQKVSGRQTEAARFTQVEAAQMVPDTLTLIYTGPVFFPIGTQPGLIQLKWYYGNNTTSWPILAFSANFDAGASATFTAESWRPLVDNGNNPVMVQVNNIAPSGEADITIPIDEFPDPTTLRRSAIESVVETINAVAAERLALRPKP